ncbi:hypothetical protein [Vibrio parahaemolyticus]|uniref:hypothetical protein n=1 Tax=Vibrio parahaemolyticus TaxID=670 RepID=UPI00235F6CD9|nr:hypothetical protein [Vibrio parahaemolyticus]
MANKKVETCYACDEISTSREHVPPKCLFPTELGVNYRKGLITVPSCDLHNGKKSDDDEFLLASLAGIIGCDDVGLLHKFTKVNRAIRRSGGRLLDKVLKEQDVKLYDLPNGGKFDVTWGKPDLQRLQECFSLIGRGLYKHKYDRVFRGNVISEVLYVPTNHRGWKGYREFAVSEMAKELSNTKVEGHNPDVFQWVLGPEDTTGASCGRLTFYGNLVVYLAFVPKSFNAENHKNLFDIAQSVTKPVYIQKDGQRYRIN